MPEPLPEARGVLIRPGRVDAATAWSVLRPGSPSAHARFHLDEREAVALQLFLAGEARSRNPDLRAARRRNGGVEAGDGALLWEALNCGACHAGDDDRFSAPNGPNLAIEGSRARPDWLRAFLRAPAAIRPFGADARGGRMPDFGLTPAEADSIAERLTAMRVSLPAFEPAPVSAFATRKLLALIETRWSCLGCHRIGDRGGRIGPDLSAVGRRLQPDYLRAIIAAPHRLVPGTSMPTPRIAPAVADQLASVLAVSSGPDRAAPAPERREITDRAGYLSPLDAPLPADGTQPVSALYARNCAACHGPGGRGDGFNARFLRRTPADHADAAAMRLRTDDRLYDGIAAGAFFLDGSPEMPAFTDLTPADVRALVAHIRHLCDCAQPAWAEDPR